MFSQIEAAKMDELEARNELAVAERVYRNAKPFTLAKGNALKAFEAAQETAYAASKRLETLVTCLLEEAAGRG